MFAKRFAMLCSVFNIFNFKFGDGLHLFVDLRPHPLGFMNLFIFLYVIRILELFIDIRLQIRFTKFNSALGFQIKKIRVSEKDQERSHQQLRRL